MPKAKKSESDESKETPVAILTATKEEKDIYVPKSKKELLEERLKPFIEEEGFKKVRGRFRFYEIPGGSTTVTVKKYPSVPEFKLLMIDGQEYEVPLYVARFLNGIDVTAKDPKIGTCSYVVHGYMWEAGKPAPTCKIDESGALIPNTDTSKKVKRFGFESLEFEKAV